MSISTHLATAAALILLASAWTAAGCRDRHASGDLDADTTRPHSSSDDSVEERAPSRTVSVAWNTEAIEECGGYSAQDECTEHLGEEACSRCTLKGDCSDCTGGPACQGCQQHQAER